MVTLYSVILHVQAYIFFILSILLCRFVFVKVPGAIPLWHTTELPGQIVVNAETEEGESQWHLEEEAPADENPSCLQMWPAAGAGGSQTATTRESLEIRVRGWHQLDHCDSTPSHQRKAPLPHKDPHPHLQTGETMGEVPLGRIRLDIVFWSVIVSSDKALTLCDLWPLSLFPLILWGSRHRKKCHIWFLYGSVFGETYATYMHLFCFAHCLDQPGV